MGIKDDVKMCQLRVGHLLLNKCNYASKLLNKVKIIGKNSIKDASLFTALCEV